MQFKTSANRFANPSYSFGRVELFAPVDRPETIVVLDYER